MSERLDVDFDQLARETPWSREEWIAAAMHLGDLPDLGGLWPSVVTLGAFYGPVGAARSLRRALLEPVRPLGCPPGATTEAEL